MDQSRQAVARRRQQREGVLLLELERVVQLLKGRPEVRLVLLFGSLAAGASGSHSDLDLVVVVDTDLPFAARLDYLYQLILPQVEIDLLAYTPAEWERLRQERPFVRRIAAEGRVVYEAAA